MKTFDGLPDMKTRLEQRARNIGVSFTSGLNRLGEGEHAWQVRRKQTLLFAPGDGMGAEYGIPVRLAYAQLGLFESMDEWSAVEWPLQFARAVPCDVDLEPVWREFALFVLADPVVGLALHAQTAAQTRAIETIIRLFREDSRDAESWAAAASAARSASLTGHGGHGRNADECLASVGGAAALSASYFAGAFAHPSYAKEAVSWAAWPLRHHAEYQHYLVRERYQPEVDDRGMVNVGDGLFCAMMNRREFDKAAHGGEEDRWERYSVYGDKLCSLMRKRGARRAWFAGIGRALASLVRHAPAH
jgi:hypothetical protein